ncbi:hypothetical protein JEQ12_005180 [Ovis aries]|uniref:Uncharacterized protein n=1 Tax=Ovis aries TaxID=9940 RepID=A0A836A3I4_SHEEP|nr:hypothetical protein JEQ12_005180 [Ovis aries]
MLLNKRSPCNEEPVHCDEEEQLPLTATRESLHTAAKTQNGRKFMKTWFELKTPRDGTTSTLGTPQVKIIVTEGQVAVENTHDKCGRKPNSSDGEVATTQEIKKHTNESLGENEEKYRTGKHATDKSANLKTQRDVNRSSMSSWRFPDFTRAIKSFGKERKHKFMKTKRTKKKRL